MTTSSSSPGNGTSTCPECGKPLPEGKSLCPACLLAQAIASRTIAGEAPEASPTAPAPPEEIADKFPAFEILECLGRGGMGAVYKARQKSLNRLVAIKILAPERERDARFASRFAREAELLAKLSHPHIVTIHDFGETGGLFYLVMEFINGVNLRDLLREGKMPPEQALAIVPPVCEALQYAHEQGIVHRDIKPENILLDRDGRVKIADFGIASLAGDAGDPSGTPAYMAPEQQSTVRIVDHRADIYALGVVLYEMLTGERPTTLPVAPSRRVRIDVRLDEVVLRALEAEPGLRYQSAGEFRTIVETVAAGEAPAAPGEWQLRCTSCGHTRSLAAAGGIRIGAASVGKRTLCFCTHCRGMRFAAVERAPAAPGQVTFPGAAPAPSAGSSWQQMRIHGVDYRSSRTLLGWPLLHISSGTDPLTGKRRVARGWIAIGDTAVGGIAMGGVAFGGIAIGGFAGGILTMGGVGIGLMAFAGLALGLVMAVGGLAVGGIALGGMAIGYYAHGGGALGKHLLSATAQDQEAVRFFYPWARHLFASMGLWMAAFMVVVFPVNFFAYWWAGLRQQEANHKKDPPPPASPSIPSGAAADSGRFPFSRSLLHMLPVLILSIVWLTSGLEKGAVLILGVVIVAMLILRLVVPPAAVEGAPASSLRRILGRQLFLFTPALLMAMFWRGDELRTATVYAFIAVLLTILFARIFTRLPFRRWIPGLIIMVLLAALPFAYEQRLLSSPLIEPEPAIDNAWYDEASKARQANNARYAPVLELSWVTEARKGSQVPRPSGPSLSVSGTALRSGPFHDFFPPEDPESESDKLVLDLSFRAIHGLSKISERKDGEHLAAIHDGKVIGTGTYQKEHPGYITIDLDPGVDRVAIVRALLHELGDPVAKPTDGVELRWQSMSSNEGHLFRNTPGVLSPGQFSYLTGVVATARDVLDASITVDHPTRKVLTLELDPRTARRLTAEAGRQTSGRPPLSIVWHGRILGSGSWGRTTKDQKTFQATIHDAQIDEAELLEHFRANRPVSNPGNSDESSKPDR